MFLDDAEADAQAETGTFTDGFRRIERIENAVRFLNAGAGVAEQNDYPAAIASGLDGESAAAVGRFHGVDCVVDDVEKNLKQLIAVAPDAGQNRFQLQFDFRGSRTQIKRTELHGVADDRV